MKKIYRLAILLITTVTIFIGCNDDEDYVDVLPIATNDTVSSTLTTPLEIMVLQNDTTGDVIIPTSVSIVNGTDTDSNGTLDRLLVNNEGTWSVNPSTGSITFTPTPTFTGNPTPIQYFGKDAENNSSNNALVTITAQEIVSVDLTQVPYARLSDYKFFIGEIKNQIPSLNVLPYKPASSLFTDYAHKKRFVWMPNGTTATYVSDDKVLDLPVGSALIKTFYYDKMQPNNFTKIIETRIMIKKASGWIFAEYVWNEDQTDALLDVSGNGLFTAITFKDDNDNLHSTNYRLPSTQQCMTCHKFNEQPIPIGIKPQNLNNNYNYGTVTKNQLTAWIEKGYLENNVPAFIESTVDYNDTSQPLELRARSYFDIQCAHCHQGNSHCDYRPMRYAFSETGGANGRANLGVCVNTQDMNGFPSALSRIITPNNFNRSMVHHRLNTTEESFRMPLLGRTIIHQEGVQLVKDWINSLTPCQ
jgi:uncharacterized repeat protein (TIGR03806 family)